MPAGFGGGCIRRAGCGRGCRLLRLGRFRLGLLPRCHQRLNLLAGERTAKIRKCPARLENLRLVLMHVVHQEDPVAQGREELVHFLPVEAVPGRLPEAPSSPSSTRSLSRLVCNRPRNQVPAFDSPL